jgi:hypothetical protein
MCCFQQATLGFKPCLSNTAHPGGKLRMCLLANAKRSCLDCPGESGMQARHWHHRHDPDCDALWLALIIAMFAIIFFGVLELAMR